MRYSGAVFAAACLGLQLPGAGTQAVAADAYSSASRIAFESDNAPDTPHDIGSRTRWGLNVGLSAEGRSRPLTVPGGRHGTIVMEPEVALAIQYQATAVLSGFSELTLTHRAVAMDSPGEERSATGVDVTQAYVSAHLPSVDATVHLGRQRFEDGRDWWYDEPLDAVRGELRGRSVGLQVAYAQPSSISEELRESAGGASIDFYLFTARAALRRDMHLATFAIRAADNASGGSRRTYSGIRLAGGLGEWVGYRADLALLVGSAQGRRLHAFAWDLGLHLRPQWPLAPVVAVGVALGSGDSGRGRGVDHGFRATGLQSYKSALDGFGDFHYYGEVLQPELSNLLVTTVALSVRPRPWLGVGLVHHYYQRHRRSPFPSGIDYEPPATGTSRELGHGLDLVAAFEPRSDISLDVAMGTFIPGQAFAEGAKSAWSARFELEYRF